MALGVSPRRPIDLLWENECTVRRACTTDTFVLNSGGYANYLFCLICYRGERPLGYRRLCLV